MRISFIQAERNRCIREQLKARRAHRLAELYVIKGYFNMAVFEQYNAAYHHNQMWECLKLLVRPAPSQLPPNQ